MSQPVGADEQPRPVSQTCLPQSTLKQLAPMTHYTSHAHDMPHEMPEHDWLPEHVTSHGPGPHAMLRHAKLFEHSTAQPVPLRQSMPLRHELGVLHLMMHENPVGHVI